MNHSPCPQNLLLPGETDDKNGHYRATEATAEVRGGLGTARLLKAGRRCCWTWPWARCTGRASLWFSEARRAQGPLSLALGDLQDSTWVTRDRQCKQERASRQLRERLAADAGENPGFLNV